MSKLIGTWTLESSENINEYLKQLGMSLAKRRQQTTLNIQPRLIVSNSDDMWIIGIDMKTKGTETIFYEGKVVDTCKQVYKYLIIKPFIPISFIKQQMS